MRRPSIKRAVTDQINTLRQLPFLQIIAPTQNIIPCGNLEKSCKRYWGYIKLSSYRISIDLMGKVYDFNILKDKGYIEAARLPRMTIFEAAKLRSHKRLLFLNIWYNVCLDIY